MNRTDANAHSILVTGGAGFIGSHLCEYLLAHGHKMIVLDDLNNFYDVELKLRNLEAVRLAGPIAFHQVDIRDSAQVFQIFEKYQPQTVIHLAARAGVRPSLEDPLLYGEVNIQGTLILLEAARRSNVRKFIFASSSSIYGMANRVPFREDDCVNEPISPYAATKIAGEKFCYTYSHLYGIQTVCLRFFTVYGPRQRPDLAICRFSRMIREGLPIPVFGDGSSGRDYTYVGDIVQGISSAVDYSCDFDTFNLGNSHPVTLDEMIETVQQALGVRANIERHPQQPGDVPITFADISKAGRLLGYSPRVPFREGIRRFVEWHYQTFPGLHLAMDAR
jgi:UDP-glucuronate 4-epimerase